MVCLCLSGLMEVPAYTVIVPFVSKLGRRPTTVGNFMLTGICMLGLAYAPNGKCLFLNKNG